MKSGFSKILFKINKNGYYKIKMKNWYMKEDDNRKKSYAQSLMTFEGCRLWWSAKPNQSIAFYWKSGFDDMWRMEATMKC